MFEETSTCDIDLNKYYLSGLRVLFFLGGGVGMGVGSACPSMIAYKCHHILDPSWVVLEKTGDVLRNRTTRKTEY